MNKVLLLLANGFELYEASVFIDVIGWNLIDGDHTTELFTCGLTKEISSSFNQKVIVDYLINEVDVNDFKALAIPGGFEEYNFYKDAYNDKFIKLIQDFNNANKIIASICVAALPLAKSGILKNKKATTYNLNPNRQNALKNFNVDVINQPIVIDNNIITSWNPSTAMNVAFLLLELLTSQDNANYIKKIMGFD